MAKKNKATTVYQQKRDALGLSREEACDLAEKYNTDLQPSRLERVETRKYPITPEEVLLLSRIYGDPTLCNHYCSNECPIGQEYVPEIKIKNLAQIVLEMLSSLNSLKNRQERLIDITADGAISSDEIKDFVFIQNELEHISITVETLQLWVEKMLADGRIDRKKYDEIKNS